MPIEGVSSRQARQAKALGDFIAALREIGVLLVALGPLEGTISSASFGTLSAFLAFGVVFFALALALEWKYGR